MDKELLTLNLIINTLRPSTPGEYTKLGDFLMRHALSFLLTKLSFECSSLEQAVDLIVEDIKSMTSEPPKEVVGYFEENKGNAV
jgi:hypothetical protein